MNDTRHVQVFGPERAAAAYAAIAELDQAEIKARWDWSDAAWNRVVEARRVRQMYYEYGDLASALAHC